MLKKIKLSLNTIHKKLVQSSFAMFCYLKLRKLYSNVDDFFKKIIGKKPVLYLLEYHVTEHCNMNCKNCFHFSHLAKQAEFGDFEQYVHDLRRLSTLFSNIREIHLMGGEPLLNPELSQFITVTKQFFPNAIVKILSNGVLIKKMKPKLIQTILKNDIELRVSIYPPMITQRDSIIEFLKQNGIRHWVSDPYLHFAKYINPEGNSNPKKVVVQCPSSRCTFLSNGKISRCSLPFNIKYFNQHFDKKIDMSKNQIDFHNLDLDGFQIKKKLLKPMGACRYCRKLEWIPWRQSKRADRSDSNLDDFC